MNLLKSIPRFSRLSRYLYPYRENREYVNVPGKYRNGTKRETGKAGSRKGIECLSLGRIMLDLLGDALPPVTRTNTKPEAAALVEVLKTLRAHPMVAWCERMNSGAACTAATVCRTCCA